MKTYIRRKGTKRWLRFKGLEDYCAEMSVTYVEESYHQWDNDHNLTLLVEYYFRNNSQEESGTYEVTQDKKNIKTVEVEYYLEPQLRASIV